MKKIISILVNIVLVACIMLVIMMLVIPALTGLTFDPVLSGSMEPTIMTGALIAIKQTDPQSIQVGDIIGFHVTGMDMPVCHRVIEIVETETGFGFRTQGDNNNSPDSWTVKPQDLIGKVYFNVAWLGQLARSIKTPIGFIMLMVLPAVAIATMEITNLFFPRMVIRKRPVLRKQLNHWPALLPVLGSIVLVSILWGILLDTNSVKTLGSFSVRGKSADMVTHRTMQNQGILPLIVCLRSTDPTVSFSESYFRLDPGQQKEIEIKGDNLAAVITTAGLLPLLPRDVLYQLFIWNSRLASLIVSAIWIIPLGLVGSFTALIIINRTKLVQRVKYMKGG